MCKIHKKIIDEFFNLCRKAAWFDQDQYISDIEYQFSKCYEEIMSHEIERCLQDNLNISNSLINLITWDETDFGEEYSKVCVNLRKIDKGNILLKCYKKIKKVNIKIKEWRKQ